MGLRTTVIGVLGAGLVACGGPDGGPGTYDAQGVVRRVDRAERQLVVDHEDIPGLMPAMTMSFDIADAALLDGLAPGQLIDFELEFTGAQYRVVGIEVTGQAGSAGSSGGGGDPLAQPRDRAPDVRLTDQDGQPFDLDGHRGRAVLLDFIFTRCPGPCPILTGRMADVQKALPAEVRARTHFVSISLDPERDTPEALRRYAEKRHLDLADWSFLTGPPELVETVVREYGVGTLRQPDGNIEHTLALFLLDPEGRIAARYLGLDHAVESIAADVARVLR